MASQLQCEGGYRHSRKENPPGLGLCTLTAHWAGLVWLRMSLNFKKSIFLTKLARFLPAVAALGIFVSNRVSEREGGSFSLRLARLGSDLARGLASFMLCVVLPAQSLVRPAVSKPTQPPASTAAVASAQNQAGATASNAFTLKDEGKVTAAYLRQHHPEALFGLAAGIKAGKVPAAQARGLLSPHLLGKLSMATPNAKARLAVQSPAGQGGAKARAPGPWRSALIAHGIALNEVEHSPANLVFPEAWDKQTVTAVLRVTSNTDGPLTAALAPNSPFLIQSLTIFDGLIVPVQGGQMAMRKVAAKVTRAPWTIMTNAGQDVEVRLAFAPHFNLFNFAAGTYKDTLTVAGTFWNPGDPKEPSWSLKVPVSGKFNGLALDVLLFAQDWHPEVVTDPAYVPSIPQTLPLVFHLMNTRDALTGTLSAEGLPPGVKAQPMNVAVGKGETKTVTLVLSIDRQSEFYRLSPREVPIPFDVIFRHDGKTIPLHLDFTIYEGFHHWSLTGTCGPFDFGASLTLTATGDFHFSADGFNGNLFRPINVQMTGGFSGSPLINCGFNVDANSSGGYHYGWNTPNVQSNYLTWIHQPLTLTVKVSTH